MLLRKTHALDRSAPLPKGKHVEQRVPESHAAITDQAEGRGSAVACCGCIVLHWKTGCTVSKVLLQNRLRPGVGCVSTAVSPAVHGVWPAQVWPSYCWQSLPWLPCPLVALVATHSCTSPCASLLMQPLLPQDIHCAWVVCRVTDFTAIVIFLDEDASGVHVGDCDSRSIAMLLLLRNIQQHQLIGLPEAVTAYGEGSPCMQVSHHSQQLTGLPGGYQHDQHVGQGVLHAVGSPAASSTGQLMASRLSLLGQLPLTN